jgi:hypothetical protein
MAVMRGSKIWWTVSLYINVFISNLNHLYTSKNLDKLTTLNVGSLPLCCLQDHLVMLPWERKRSMSDLCPRKRLA